MINKTLKITMSNSAIKFYIQILLQFLIIIQVLSIKYNLKGKHGEGYLLDVALGEPAQNFRVVLDTGSSNFAILTDKNPYSKLYFNPKKSKTFQSLDKLVSSQYAQGKWSGELGYDLLSLPTVANAFPVKTHVSLIRNSTLFFKENSEWQGLLGLAYPAISRPDSSVLSWIDALKKESHINSISFSLELCGATSINGSHFGEFQVLFSNEELIYKSPSYEAIIAHEYYYEIIVSNISVGGQMLPSITCFDINSNKAIVDSGSTNLILPAKVYDKLIESLINFNVVHNLTLTKEFWSLNETSCFDSPQDWNNLPPISLSIVSSDSSYFVVDLPGSSYIKSIFHSDYQYHCYKVAIEKSDGNIGTILGAITMEGLKLIFNRTSRTIEYQKGTCGPNVQLRGPYHHDNVIEQCSVFNTDESNFGYFFRRNILIIFFISLTLTVVSLIVVLVKTQKSCLSSRVFITIRRSSELLLRNV